MLFINKLKESMSDNLETKRKPGDQVELKDNKESDEIDEIKVRKPEREGDSCLLYTSPSPRDLSTSRMPSSA